MNDDLLRSRLREMPNEELCGLLREAALPVLVSYDEIQTQTAIGHEAMARLIERSGSQSGSLPPQTVGTRVSDPILELHQEFNQKFEVQLRQWESHLDALYQAEQPVPDVYHYWFGGLDRNASDTERKTARQNASLKLLDALQARAQGCEWTAEMRALIAWIGPSVPLLAANNHQEAGIVSPKHPHGEPDRPCASDSRNGGESKPHLHQDVTGLLVPGQVNHTATGPVFVESAESPNRDTESELRPWSPQKCFFEMEVMTFGDDAGNGFGLRIRGWRWAFPWGKISRILSGIPTVRIDLLPRGRCLSDPAREYRRARREQSKATEDCAHWRGDTVQKTASPQKPCPPQYQGPNPDAESCLNPAHGCQTATGDQSRASDLPTHAESPRLPQAPCASNSQDDGKSKSETPSAEPPVTHKTLTFSLMLSRALRGETPYIFGVSIPRDGYRERVVATVMALSSPHAIQQVTERFPQGMEITLTPANVFVGIQRFVAHPCRAARWIFSHREMASREYKAVLSVLGIQAVKRAWKEIQHGLAPGIGPVATDTQAASSLPDNEAAAPVTVRNPISTDDVHAAN